MFDYSHLAAFMSASFLLAITPGPDIVYTLTRGLTQGRKAGLFAAMGFNFGNLFHTALAVLGVTAILRTSPAAYAGIKYAGAAYLIYIGIRTWRSRPGGLDCEGPEVVQPWAIFRQTVVCNILNPKVALFFLAFLPQFVDQARGSVPMQMAIYGLLFIVVSFPVFVCAALFAGTIGNWLQGNPAIEKRLMRMAGAVLVGLGIFLALPDSV